MGNMRVEHNDWSLSLYHVTPEEMRDFAWPQGIEYVSFFGDYLEELVVPNGVNRVFCTNLGLRRLVLPSTVVQVYANMNSLRELTVPSTIMFLELSYNPLYNLYFNGGDPMQLARLVVCNTNISSLEFRVSEDCTIDATSCKYLKYLTKDTSFAVRDHIRDLLDQEEMMEEPKHWIICDPSKS